MFFSNFTIGSVVEARVSLLRLKKFLNATECDPNAVVHIESTVNAITISEGSFSWVETATPTLSNITLAIPKGSLVAVCGPVASGKTALLSAVLGGILIFLFFYFFK